MRSNAIESAASGILIGIGCSERRSAQRSVSVAVAFDDTQHADRVLTELTELQKEYLIDLEDAVVAIRGADGKLHLKQSVDLVGRGAAGGGFWGCGVPLSVSSLSSPLLGLVAGGALGAGTGALSGSLADCGIKDDFIRKIGDRLQATRRRSSCWCAKRSLRRS